MDELSSEASRLLDVSGLADAPSVEILHKIRAGIAAATGVAVGTGALGMAANAATTGSGVAAGSGTAASAGAGAATTSATASGLLGAKGVIVAMLTGAIGFGGGALVTQRGQSRPDTEAAAGSSSVRAASITGLEHAAAASPVIATAGAPVAAPPNEAAIGPSTKRPAATPTIPPVRPSTALPDAATPTATEAAPRDLASPLAAELQVIRSAGFALSLTDAERALELLDQHAARFTDGQLVQERESLRVLALCALDRFDEAAASARAFVATWPDSPHAARLRTSCVRAVLLEPRRPANEAITNDRARKDRR